MVLLSIGTRRANIAPKKAMPTSAAVVMNKLFIAFLLFCLHSSLIRIQRHFLLVGSILPRVL